MTETTSIVRKVYNCAVKIIFINPNKCSEKGKEERTRKYFVINFIHLSFNTKTVISVFQKKLQEDGSTEISCFSKHKCDENNVHLECLMN